VPVVEVVSAICHMVTIYPLYCYTLVFSVHRKLEV
jgi:hypothetical protein